MNHDLLHTCTICSYTLIIMYVIYPEYLVSIGNNNKGGTYSFALMFQSINLFEIGGF